MEDQDENAVKQLKRHLTTKQIIHLLQKIRELEQAAPYGEVTIHYSNGKPTRVSVKYVETLPKE